MARLTKFATVSGAVECAVAMQAMLIERDNDRPEGRHLKFRMCINLGEITVDEDDFYGEGVNVAARLEALSQPDGVCLSKSILDSSNFFLLNKSSP